MDDIKRALLGDKEAAGRLTEAGVLLPCPWCGRIPEIATFDRFIVYECVCGKTRCYPGYLQTKESLVLASAPESAIKEYYHRDADKDARLSWNTRAPILSENGQHLYENAERAYMKVLAELEQVKQERDAAIKEIFQWTGCPACKHWDSADNWCNKHDRSADSCDGCSTPEWHGLHKEE